ncbi:MAG: ABC transporter permease subunit [Chloroflexota bacterium]
MPIPLWRDVRVLRVVAQIVFVAVVVLIGWWLAANMAGGLSKGKPLTFDFLQNAASFALAESPIPYDPDQSYAYAFLVGVLNTLRVAVVGIVLASIVGLLMGIARLSTNWLVANLARGYVEALRNTPLLIQLFVWYFAGVLKLPRVRESIALPGSIFLSNRGLTLPWFDPTENFSAWLQLAVGGIVVAVIVYVLMGLWSRTANAVPSRGFWATFIVLLATLGSGVLMQPFVPTVPQIIGFNYTGGATLSPEYTALLFGLVVYTSAFIAEIVRAGIQSVPRGLSEASRALGLSHAQTLRLVTIPLALRVIIPPLTNQYLNLTKNSSLAAAIAYADLFYISQTILNQSGQTLPVIVMIMAAYLTMSLAIAFVMNRVNARFKLVER